MQKESKKAVFRNWHPDFRIADTLPDVKVVRTGFLVNFIAIMIAVVLLGMNVYREVRMVSLNSDVAKLETRIADGSAQNKRNLKLSSTFTKQAKIVDDLATFYTVSEPPLDFIVAITENRPENIAFESIRFRIVNVGTGKKLKKEEFRSIYQIEGVLKGSSAEALIALNNYRNALMELDEVKDLLESIDVSQPRRNADLGLFEFQIQITLKPQP